MTPFTPSAGRKGWRNRLLVLVMLFSTSSLPAQTNLHSDAEADTAPRRPARYLVVLETSAAMRKRSENTQKAIGYLLAGALKDQLREGDTIGVWAFDEKLRTGDFPLQVWSPAARTEIAKKVVDFYASQKFEKDPHLETVFAPLSDLIRHSERITVLLITSGENPMHGTPFDVALNETYKRSKEDLKKGKLPFVTVLRAWHSEVIGGSVTWSPWPVEFPKFPPEPKIVEAPKPVEAEAAKPVAPLILTGTKPVPSPEPPVETPAPSETPSAQAQPSTTESLSAHPETPAVAVTVPPPAAPIAEPAAQPEPVTPRVESAPHEPLAAPVVEKLPATTAAAVPPAPTASSKRMLLMVSLGLLIVGVILIVLLVRRASRSGRASLITRSMEQGKK